MIRWFPFLGLLVGCTEPPPDFVSGLRVGDTGPSFAPGGAKALSAEGVVLLDLDQIQVQQTQQEIRVSGVKTVFVSGELFGTCPGTLRIDIIKLGAHRSMRIELGIAPTSTGALFGPITALYPEAAGPFTAMVPKGENVQIAAICDVNKDNKIVQGTDKLTPVIALGELDEDKGGLVLAFPGERPGIAPSSICGRCANLGRRAHNH